MRRPFKIKFCILPNSPFNEIYFLCWPAPTFFDLQPPWRVDRSAPVPPASDPTWSGTYGLPPARHQGRVVRRDLAHRGQVDRQGGPSTGRQAFVRLYIETIAIIKNPNPICISNPNPHWQTPFTLWEVGNTLNLPSYLLSNWQVGGPRWGRLLICTENRPYPSTW